MARLRNEAGERRRYIRLEAPIEIAYTVPESGKIHKAKTKNISADGLRFEAHDKTLKESDLLELKLIVPQAANPVHASGRIIWKNKLSLEDNAPFDFGLEFSGVEEDNKNTFLKFFCDLIYEISKEPKDAIKKK